MVADRLRRSCLAVPGSNERMMQRAMSATADEVFLDLEDAVAIGAKEAARGLVVRALAERQWCDQIRAVRINDVTTPWALDDVCEVVTGAGDHLDVIILPKVEHVAHIHWLDATLSLLEHRLGLSRRIGIEIQIEGPGGWQDLPLLAAASDRLQAIIFGPWDFIAAMRMPADDATRVVGPERFDAVRLAIVATCRRSDLAAIDGPYPEIRNEAGLRVAAERAADLGFDGKWALHPDQIQPINDAFSPPRAEYDHALAVLAACDAAAEAGRGAVMLGDQMIDEASRRIAESVVARGRRAVEYGPESAAQ